MSKKQSSLLYWLFSFINAVVSELDVQQTITLSSATPHTTDFPQRVGYISGNPAHPVECPETATVRKGPGNVFRCCGSDDCWLPSSCAASDSAIYTSSYLYSQITQSTDAASPSCAEYILQASGDDQSPYTNSQCLANSSTILVLAVTTVEGGSGSSSVESSGMVLATFVVTGPNNNGDGGLSREEKIAVGVGLSVPLAALIIAILAWCWPRRSRK